MIKNFKNFSDIDLQFFLSDKKSVPLIQFIPITQLTIGEDFLLIFNKIRIHLTPKKHFLDKHISKIFNLI
ncbi:hypothetical protein BpHYR1_018264 [Brachionus plicatilis]|uniref:Uncharacterized protein n=1 Tax=Brachionus plicatilis TaxID=10195 RepID=A0A3M7Q2S3_BRAPC|nr:hypothetical protein BpHYR1_018264 [Brachionus plicatilis]